MCQNCTSFGHTKCPFCEDTVRTTRYAEHLDRHHKGGKLYRPFNNRPKKTINQLLADSEFPLVEVGSIWDEGDHSDQAN